MEKKRSKFLSCKLRCKSVWRHIIEKADTEWSNGIFWGLTFALAALATFYTNEIKGISPSSSSNSADENSSVIPAICFAIAFFLLTLYSIAISYAKKQAEKKSLAEIKTSPPSDYWLAYYNYFMADVRRSKDIAELEDGMEIESFDKDRYDEALAKAAIGSMGNVLELALKWDYSIFQGNVTYWVNIMKKHPAKIDGAENPILKEINSNLDIQCIIKDFDYFLTPIKGLSIIYTDSMSQEESNGNIILPILNGSTIPGAPAAIANRQYSYIDNTERIATMYGKGERRDLKFQGTLETYYRGCSAKSIFSIPVGENYVLSIYRDREDMLYGGAKAEDFSYMLAPFSENLNGILSRISP